MSRSDSPTLPSSPGAAWRPFRSPVVPFLLTRLLTAFPFAVNLAATAWPTNWEQPPAIDSAQVKEWLKELEGHTIPNIALNKKVNGSNGVICADNPDGVKNAGADKNCWWTCGGCVRNDDISTCKNKMTYGHTYDDGPVSLILPPQNVSIKRRTIASVQGIYTNKLLTYLGSRDLKATFFLVGPRIISRPEIVVYEHMNGHELG